MECIRAVECKVRSLDDGGRCSVAGDGGYTQGIDGFDFGRGREGEELERGRPRDFVVGNAYYALVISLQLRGTRRSHCVGGRCPSRSGTFVLGALETNGAVLRCESKTAPKEKILMRVRQKSVRCWFT